MNSKAPQPLRWFAVLLLTGPGVVACGDDGPSMMDASGDETGAGTGTTGATWGATGTEAGDTGLPGESAEPAPSTRFFRLTHDQWENTVQDLFRLASPTGLSAGFRTDARESGYLFEQSATGLEVDQALWNNYRFAAGDVARQVVREPAVLQALLPVDGGDDVTRARLFIEEFGLRAFRRPLTSEEIQAHEQLFFAASNLYADSDGFEAGVRMVIEAMLQSPNFLYRVETSATPQDGVVPLSDFELASRLSYFLWSSMPDDALLAAAVDGTLSTTLEAHAQRMLDDPRATRTVQQFHETLFRVEKFANIERSQTFFPNAPEDLGALATEEFRRFVAVIIFEESRGLTDLLTSNESFVNDKTAALYGLPAQFGETMQRAELPPGQRRGVLTQLGFLASNATSVNPDPIHRGVFILDRLVCADLPAPPDVVPPLPEVEGQTNREAIEELTEVPGSVCAGCHKGVINPYGFPFENYDAAGGFRVIDNGFAIDSSSTIALDGGLVDVANPFILIDALAHSPAVHRCYAKHWVEFLQGRPASAQDDVLVERLGRASLDEALPVRSLLTELVRSVPFRSRSIQELGT